jgi:aspartate/methionine/tyrosine aminotransferase
MRKKQNWSSVIQGQPMFDVLARAQEQEVLGNYVARMEIGDTPGFENEMIIELLEKYARSPHRYSPSKGEPTLIEAVRLTQWENSVFSDYEVSIAPANFLITAALAAVSKPGDFVLLPDPGFATYKIACDFLSLRIVYYKAPESSSDFLDLCEKFNKMRQKPKAIIVNNPSNPGGLATDGKLWTDVLHRLKNRGTEIIIDETYVNLVYVPIDPIIQEIPAIRIRSFSKENCAPGLRIGYIAANQRHSEIISNFISLTISCSPRFIQLAIAEYLKSDAYSNFQIKVRQTMKERFAYLLTQVEPKNFLYIPNSAFYALLKTGEDSKAFEFFMQNNVATCPGSKFGDFSSGTLRISLAGKSETFQSNITMLKNTYDKWLSNLI